MTTDSSRPRDLLQRFGSMAVPADDAQASEARRTKVVDHVSALVRQERRRSARLRALRPAMFAALLAAAVLSLVVGWTIVRGRNTPSATSFDTMTALAGSVSILRQGASIQPGTSPMTVRNEDEISTSQDGQARLSLAQGTSIAVFPGSRLRVVPATSLASSIDLQIGRVEVEVPKLGPSGIFAVITPHAQIVVHGTRFVVEVSARRPDGIAPTTVHVTEGRVAVQTADREVMLEAGATWSNEAQTASVFTATEPASAPPPSGAAPAASPATRALAAGAVDAGASAPGSTLSEENRLFKAAMDARRRGNDAEAIRQLDALLGRYPNSTLAQEARVERFRSLKRLGQDAAAAGEARRYLAEHPDGFARDEARGMALPAAPSSSR